MVEILQTLRRHVRYVGKRTSAMELEMCGMPYDTGEMINGNFPAK